MAQCTMKKNPKPNSSNPTKNESIFVQVKQNPEQGKRKITRAAH